ncbi:GcrA cell cycle regulator [Gluconobacter sp. Dm-62]|uniref:GcrA family cell cycle regulator n=1 Tax=Gluconobacter sp. Dm-62 TaxID=2799804 RepID=UPI001B8B0C59|nr:GcrA family cell cycle regulator [Gluconobacter sp. Dm-62]MBS1101526.1 GcrA cell cycle regulator [Gluconobacter sp. Dm-62]
MEWTDETIARLRDLWSQGLSTAEIGRQLSITKNAVVGKAHRLGLPPRPSPIRNRKAADGETGTTEAAPRRKSPSRAKAADAAGSDLFADGKDSSSDKVVSAATDKKTAEKSVAQAQNTISALPETTKRTPQPVVASRPAPAAPKEPVAPRREPAAVAKPEPRVAPMPRPAIPPRFSTAGIDRPTRRGPSCCWPIGDPGTPGFHFCGATPLSGKPYCAEHAAIAYVKIRDRRD